MKLSNCIETEISSKFAFVTRVAGKTPRILGITRRKGSTVFGA